MANNREPTSNRSRSKRPPARTPEAREQQLVGLAIDLAEQQMRDGTATSQVIAHFLKLGSTREQLEQIRLAKENALLDAKVDAIANQAKTEELYQKALEAMRSYKPPSEFDE